MQTLLIISASAFALAVGVWFSTWVFWIHPTEGWIGKRIVSVIPIPEIEAVKKAAWFRWLRVVTILLGLTTLILFGMMMAAHLSSSAG